jgi:hypothetical protein
MDVREVHPALVRGRLVDKPHQLAQACLGVWIAPHPVPVDAERERRVLVPELIHHGARIGSERDE